MLDRSAKKPASKQGSTKFTGNKPLVKTVGRGTFGSSSTLPYLSTVSSTGNQLL